MICSAIPMRKKAVTKNIRIDDNTIADHVHYVRPTNTGWYKMKLVGTGVVDNRVPCVIPSRKPRDNVCVFGEEVDYLPLSLVTPLCAQDGVSRHTVSFQTSGQFLRGHPAQQWACVIAW